MIQNANENTLLLVNMDLLVSAVHLGLRIVPKLIFFPLTHVVFPVIRLFYSLVNHIVLIPVFLIFRTFVYGFVYMPLVPVLKVAEIHYDALAPVELMLYRLAIGFLPHIHAFLYHFIHYFMMSMFVGSFVGAVAGFNISVVARIFHIREANEGSSMKRLHELPATPSEYKRIKRESPFAQKPLAISSKTQSKGIEKPSEELVHTSPKVKSEPRLGVLQAPELAEFSGDTIFEDDDGYNFMTYKVSEERLRNRRNDGYKKRRDNRQRPVPPLLQMTIEEESEPELTSTPTQSTSTVFPTKHVSLAYATGTIGSSKTTSTDCSVFSKALDTTSPELKDDTLPDSPNDTDDGEEDMSCKDNYGIGIRLDGSTRGSLSDMQPIPDADETVTDDASAKEEQETDEGK